MSHSTSEICAFCSRPQVFVPPCLRILCLFLPSPSFCAPQPQNFGPFPPRAISEFLSSLKILCLFHPSPSFCPPQSHNFVSFAAVPACLSPSASDFCAVSAHLRVFVPLNLRMLCPLPSSSSFCHPHPQNFVPFVPVAARCRIIWLLYHDLRTAHEILNLHEQQ